MHAPTSRPRSARPACSSTARSRSTPTTGLAGWRDAIAAAARRCLKVCDVNLRRTATHARERARAVARSDRGRRHHQGQRSASSRGSPTGSAGAIRSRRCAPASASSRSRTARDGSTLYGEDRRRSRSPACARAPGGDNVGCGDAFVAILVHGMTLGWDLATSGARREPLGGRGRGRARRDAAVRRRRRSTDAARRGRVSDEPRSRRPPPKRATPRPPRACASPRSRRPTPWDRAGRWLVDARRRCPRSRVHHDRGASIIHARIFRGETAGDDLSFHFAESRAPRRLPARTATSTSGIRARTPATRRAYYYQVLPQLASALPAAIFGHHLFWFQLSVVLPLVLAPRRARIAACACSARRRGRPSSPRSASRS